LLNVPFPKCDHRAIAQDLARFRALFELTDAGGTTQTDFDCVDFAGVAFAIA
jgi:hypothetical protein